MEIHINEYNSESRNKLLHLWSIDFHKKGEGESFQQIVLGSLDK